MDHERHLPPRVVAALERMDDLVQSFEQHPDPEVQASVVELLQCIDTIHRSGLRRLADLLKEAGLTERALEAPEFRLLYELYNLAEGGDHARVEAVLASVRSTIESHGGTLDLVEADAGVVTVRLAVGGRNDHDSVPALRTLIEQTLREGLPDFVHLDILELAPAPPKDFVPLASLGKPKRRRLTWETILHVEEMPVGAVRNVEVEGERVLVANLDGELFAYRNACPGTPLPLHGGKVESGILECPWHHCRFDLHSGKRLSSGVHGLYPIPIEIKDGAVRIGIREGAAA